MIALVVIVLAALYLLSAGRWVDPEGVWEAGEAELRAGRIDRAKAAVERLQRLRQPTPHDWMFRGQVDIALGRDDEGLRALGNVPDTHWMAAQARLMAGQVELRRHRARFAERLLREAIRLDPGLVKAHGELIYILGHHLRRAELDIEFEALSRLTELTFANVLHWGLLRTVQWEPGPTIHDLSAFIAADPDDRWARLALAESFRRLGMDEGAEDAIAPLADPDPEALAIRVMIAMDRHQHARAEELLKSGPEAHPLLARLRGRQALARRDAAGAEHYFGIAYAESPDNREVILGLISALRLRGDDRAASILLERAKQLDRLNSLIVRASVLRGKKDLELYRELGAACEVLGRHAEAAAWYKLVLADLPLDPETQRALFRINAQIRSRSPGSRDGARELHR
jgi:tetratricopeptide (TPR) repeat protein